MKKLILLFLVALSLTSYSQSKTFQILIGEDENSINQYYNSLIRMFPSNSYLKIESDVDESGNKILKLELPTDREGKMGFISTVSRFRHLKDGSEICTQQFFFCDNDSVSEYLNYFKENYVKSSDSSWTTEFNDMFDLVATFKRGDLSVISILLKNRPTIK
jgi:hypothetical protein